VVGLAVRQNTARQSRDVDGLRHTDGRVQSHRPGAVPGQANVSTTGSVFF